MQVLVADMCGRFFGGEIILYGLVAEWGKA